MKNKISITIILSIFSIMSLTIYLLYSENQSYVHKNIKLKSEIKKNSNIYTNKLDSINRNIRESFSKIDSLKQSNKSNNNIIEGFDMNGKTISIKALLKIFNNTLEENISLKNKNHEYKQLFDFIEKNYGISTQKKDSTYTFIIKPDSKFKINEKQLNKNLTASQNELEEKKFLLKHLEERYGIKYKVVTENGKITSTVFITKLDSALWLYPYYKHKIKVDKKGNIIIK